VLFEQLDVAPFFFLGLRSSFSGVWRERVLRFSHLYYERRCTISLSLVVQKQYTHCSYQRESGLRSHESIERRRERPFNSLAKVTCEAFFTVQNKTFILMRDIHVNDCDPVLLVV
jgi:hypothetical protein